MSRLGLHFYPDTLHYSQKQLQAWLPVLQELGVSWLTLVGSPARAVPEGFINGLLLAGIEPVIHIPLAITDRDATNSLTPIIKAYADWGVKYVALFDRPNVHSSWPAGSWVAGELVDRFLDIYIPLAKLLVSYGIAPVFPPLEPGGDFWDTTFLSAALNSLVRRNQVEVVERLVIGAYGWFNNHPLHWGIGGPERWPNSQPYGKPPAGEDHQGFRIFDWYQAIAAAATGLQKQVILLKAGQPDRLLIQPDQPVSEQVGLMKLILALRGDEAAIHTKHPKYAFELDESLMACNFWLLTAPAGHPSARATWYDDAGQPSPFARGLKKALSKIPGRSEIPIHRSQNGKKASHKQPFTHYVLLPEGNQEFVERCMAALEPTRHNQQVAVGFSLLEAALARHVICCNGDGPLQVQQIEQLSRAGCQVHKPDLNGINLAQYVASLT
jgi:hypothetical protein